MERSQARLRPSLGVSVFSRVRELGACGYVRPRACVMQGLCRGVWVGGTPPDARSRIGLSVKC